MERRAKLERFTRSPAAIRPGYRWPVSVDVVLVAEPADPRDEAFARARALVTQGKRVLLFGHGVTLEHVWPPWVRGEERLLLVEWGALHEDDRAFCEKPLQDDVNAWLAEVFGEDRGRTLYGPMVCRTLLPLFDYFPYARTLVEELGDRPISFVSPNGPVAEIVARLRGEPLTHKSPRAWAARLVATASVALGGTLGRQVVHRLRARASFARLDELRRSRPGTSPRAWVALLADWVRINHQLLDAFALDEARSGGPLGVLLVGSLQPGAVDEHDMRKRVGEDLWPALAPLAPHLDQCVVEQVVMPRAPLAFARTLARSALASARAITKLASRKSIAVGGVEVDLTGHAFALATVATLELLRAEMAAAAVEELGPAGPSPGSAALFCTSGSAFGAGADLALQRRGVVTADHPHGAISDAFVAADIGISTLVCAWELPDRRGLEAIGRASVVTGMPRRVRARPRSGAAKRILVMSNYAHRDQEVRGYFPNEPFQTELLEVVRGLRARGVAIEARWRPHPADIDAVVRRALRDDDDITLSRGVPIEEDAAWADLVVTSNSTALVEMLFAGVPVFAHLTPEIFGLTLMSFLDEERVFATAAEGLELVHRFLAAESSDEARRAPEQRTLERLFGPSLEPVPMRDYFGARATRPLPVAQPVLTSRTSSTPSCTELPEAT